MVEQIFTLEELTKADIKDTGEKFGGYHIFGQGDERFLLRPLEQKGNYKKVLTYNIKELSGDDEK